MKKHTVTVKQLTKQGAAGSKTIEVFTVKTRSKLFYHYKNLIFNYCGTIYETKALITGDSQLPLYKIVIWSSWNSQCSICWLQKQAMGWEVLIGNIGYNLKQSLIKAIELSESHT